MTVIIERVKVLNVLVKHSYALDKLLKKINLPEEVARKHIEALTNLGLIERHDDGEFAIVKENETKINKLVNQYV